MPPVVLPAPAGAWAKHQLPGGGEDWRWVGQGVPDILSFGDELSPQNVQVRWREPAKTAQQSNTPVTVERQLYRLIPGEEEMSFTMQPVTSNETDSDALYLDEITNEIDSDALYLDEITLTSEQDAVLRYGQVEVPLPPGADVERTTWGISVNKPNAAKQQGQLLEKARNEMGRWKYRSRREPTLSAQHGAFQSINPTPRNSRGNCWKKRVMKWANWPICCR